MNELDVFRLLLARRENYGISEIAHISGRAYNLIMNGRTYKAVVLPRSFDFYEMRYHIAKRVPELIICFVHDTVVPVACLSLKSGRIALPYELPAHITNVETQRHRSKIGSQCLLGMYLCGMRAAQDIIHHKDFPKTTRKRYIQRAKELGKRRPGRPVNSIAS
ncbi:MAG TPA: hypothetical protein VK667_13070 [Ktedonobacteraceae bacterium]|nr:hypothetical protein [Ktedonobacteraceae bacterium]